MRWRKFKKRYKLLSFFSCRLSPSTISVQGLRGVRLRCAPGQLPLPQRGKCGRQLLSLQGKRWVRSSHANCLWWSVPQCKQQQPNRVFKSDSLTKNLPLFSSSSLEEPESILVAQWDELDIQVVTFEPKVEKSGFGWVAFLEMVFCFQNCSNLLWEKKLF